ncbi:discoidin domain-containing protein [Paenibacillus daejeonensis]|uniref:discoidin domain-containing protein n=1 Tax=Paenibacillus daejeonensis TaxID=135193 RepID=UPI00036E037A|nr:discoidin domain-containing protein [Paenibacillus daejeonensis]
MNRLFNKPVFLLALAFLLCASLIHVPPASAEPEPDETVTASYTYPGDQLAHVIDGIISYNETPKNRWTAYESPNSQDWIRTTYASARTKDAVGIYLFADGGGVREPAAIQVQYWDGTGWSDVAEPVATPAQPAGNELNLITFEPVTATDFRVLLTHGAAKSGVTELRYWDSSVEPLPGSEVVPLGIVSASYTFRLDQAGHLNDGIVSYTDDPKNRWTAYESPNASDWIQTNFGSPVVKDAVGLYLFADGGGVKLPQSYDVQYQDAQGEWVTVPGQVRTPQQPQGNALNLVTFTSTEAQRFRIVFVHADGAGSGATEITYVDSTRHTLPAEPSAGTATASYAHEGDPATVVNDGIVSFTDFPRNRWTAYGTPHASDWVETTYPSPRSVNAAGIYLYDDGGGVQAPTTLEIQYWNGSDFVAVPNPVLTPEQPTGNSLLLAIFDTVISDRFRVLFTHAPGTASGATEIVYVDNHMQPLPPPATVLVPDPYILVLSPELGSAVSGATELHFYSPDVTHVRASIWRQPDDAHPDPNGYAFEFPLIELDGEGYGDLSFNAADFPSGPLTVVLHGWDANDEDEEDVTTADAYVQLYNEGGVAWRIGLPAAPPQAQGMTVKFQDDFTGPLSVSKTGVGTTYTSTKPDWPNGSQFGEAIFADPTDAVNPFAILGDDFLRIRVTKAPDGYVDPMGWNRKYIGGLLSSVRLDGTGISATNGYFEARMLMPAGKGAWPAFWLMSQNSSGPNHLPSTAELDTIEGYGHNPSGACQATHWWAGNPEMHMTNCSSDNYAFGNSASTWHIYGTKVTPEEIIYYIDNVEVWRHPTFEQANTPLYFMINLALGGGWPIDLDAYHNQLDLYVDYVRVFEPAGDGGSDGGGSGPPTGPPAGPPAGPSGPTESEPQPGTEPGPTVTSGVIQPVFSQEASGMARSSFGASAWQTALQQARDAGKRTIVVDVPVRGDLLQELPPEALSAADGVSLEIRTLSGSVTLPSGWLAREAVETGSVSLQLAWSGSKLSVTVLIDGQPAPAGALLLPMNAVILYTPTPAQLAAPEFLVITRAGRGDTHEVIASGRYDAARAGVRFQAKPHGTFSVGYHKKSFADAPVQSDMRHAIEVLAAKGIVRGVSAERFEPRAALTRADYVTLLMRVLMTEPADEGRAAFADVDPQAYYSGAVAAARAMGIVQGTGDNRFEPTRPISREEMTLLTYRALVAAGLLEDNGTPAEALQHAGLLRGTGNGLALERGATRAEAATVIYRIYQLL